jgi:hypothetical protein
MSNSVIALLVDRVDTVVANVSVIWSYLLGVILLVVPLSVFGEVWSFLHTVPPERLSPFSTALLLLSYGVVLSVMSVSERNPNDPSKRAPIEAVFKSATSWWVFFLLVSLAFVSAFLWVIGRATLDVVNYFMWCMSSTVGISVESFKTIRGEKGLTRPLYTTLTEELDHLISSARSHSSSVVDASEFFEVTNYMVEVLESDPELRLMRRMSEPIEEIAETLQKEGASQLPLATVEKTRNRVEKYYQNRLKVLRNQRMI